MIEQVTKWVVDDVTFKAKPGTIKHQEDGWKINIPTKIKVGPFKKIYGELIINDIKLEANKLIELEKLEVHSIQNKNEYCHSSFEINDIEAELQLLNVEFGSVKGTEIEVMIELALNFEGTEIDCPALEVSLKTELEVA
jgi:hypothetical protein